MRRRGGAKERKKEKERETRAKLGRDSTRVLTRAAEETTRVSKTERRSRRDALVQTRARPLHAMRLRGQSQPSAPRQPHHGG